jgi:glycyl-tRNA synthetase
MEKLVNASKQYGFIFQGSEIYGGLANTWDFGPLGSMLKNNVKGAWIKRFVQEDKNNVLIDGAILMNPKVWEASGHLKTFNDPLIDCKSCKTRYRADKLLEDNDVDASHMTRDDMVKYINEHQIKCPKCGKVDYTDIREFNLMFKTFQGVTEESTNTIYLRPEVAQSMFVNFNNVQRSMRLKLPFGICGVGKSFRNEITPGNFIFRVREFEQMELEFFCYPGTEIDWFNHYKEYSMKFLKDLGLPSAKLRFREHTAEELSFYSNATVDIEYKYPFGFGELWGIASRTDYDLTQHEKHSGERMQYLCDDGTWLTPYVVEPSLGVERLVLALLSEAYTEEELDNGTREVMKFHPFIAPYKVAVFPLIKKNHKDKAEEVFRELSKHFMTTYDESGNIGKRYRRQDAIGTPFCITIDDNTLENNEVTIRDRDSMEQVTIKLEDVKSYINERIKF